MLEIISCPQCGAPAEITQRFWLDSTDGPIQHLRIICVSKHWLTPRSDTVDQQWPATRSQPRAPGGARQPRS
jgi:hypothetical protein